MRVVRNELLQHIGFILASLLFLLAGCSGAGEATPTPFSLPSPTSTIAVSKPLPLPITDLAASPAFFEGTMLQLTGQFQRLPKLVCSNETFASPASWGLVAGGLLAQAGGFDAPLRTLVPNDLTITVEGRWLRWQGPVGCGKKAVQQDLWYLEVTEIVSPSPLTLVTLTPGGDEAAEEVAQAELPAESTPTAVFEADPVDEEGDPDEELPPSEEAGDEDSDLDEAIDPEGTPTAVSPIVPTVTPTISPTPVQIVTETAVPTTDSTQPTPTSTPTNGTDPTATPNTTAGTVIDQGNLDPEEPAVATLNDDDIHEWTFEPTDDTLPLTVSVAAIDADVTVTLFDANNSQVATAQTAASTQIATIANQTITSLDTYTIQVTANDGLSTPYAILVTTDDAESVRFAGVLDSGDEQEVTLGVDQFDYWIFWAEEGDSATIQVTPQDDAEPFVILYDSENDALATSDNINGVQEIVISLENSGIYLIWVEEFDFQSMDYMISLTIE